MDTILRQRRDQPLAPVLVGVAFAAPAPDHSQCSSFVTLTAGAHCDCEGYIWLATKRQGKRTTTPRPFARPPQKGAAQNARALTRRWTALTALAAIRFYEQTLLEVTAHLRDASDGAEVGNRLGFPRRPANERNEVAKRRGTFTVLMPLCRFCAFCVESIAHALVDCPQHEIVQCSLQHHIMPSWATQNEGLRHMMSGRVNAVSHGQNNPHSLHRMNTKAQISLQLQPALQGAQFFQADKRSGQGLIQPNLAFSQLFHYARQDLQTHHVRLA